MSMQTSMSEQEMSAPQDADTADRAELYAHYEQCLHETRDTWSRGGIREYGSYVTASDGLTCTRDHRWAESHLRKACKNNILVYIIPHKSEREGVQRLNARQRARAAVATESFRADPDLVLAQRSYFMECLWSEDAYPDHDLENHLHRLIREHLRLCDWLESESDRTQEKRNAAEPDASEWNGVMPTMRAMLMLFWPDDRYSSEVIERAALVLTGDDSDMRSGPIGLENLSDHRLSEYSSNGRIIRIPLAKAVDFLSTINKREVAANAALHARDEYYLAETREECMDKARKRLALAKTGETSAVAEIFAHKELARQRRRQILLDEGLSERDAMLAAMSAA